MSKRLKKENFSLLKKHIAAEFKSKKFKNGAYSSAIIVVILVAVVFVNLLFSEFDLSIDLSTEGTYTLTDQTKKVMDGVKDDVTIYYVVQDGSEITMIKNILRKYPGLSDKVKLVNKDPDLYPTFVQKYTGTDTDVSSNSVIVVNETTGVYKYIPYTDMLVYDDTDYSYYYTGSSSSPSAIDVEGQVTAAIQYVSNENNAKLYQVTGHGETELTSYVTSEFTKLCTTVDFLQTRSASEVPEDCDILMINGPTTDYTEAEVTLIKEYLENGGKAFILVNPQATGLTNFNGLVKQYGVEVKDGVIMESASNSISNYPYYLIPTIATSDLTTGISINTNPILIPISVGLTNASTRDTVTLTPFLTTSDDAFLKQGTEWQSYDKESQDIEGPFTLGVLASETYNDVTTEVVVLSSSNLIADDFMQYDMYGNATLVNNIISYLGGQETGLSIPSRSLSEAYITPTSANVVMWSIILIVIIPIVLLATGFVIWYRRRKA
ncbi:MAG: GldG family protein [bacterium]|nr:GldG family protein [bacterium]